MYAVFCFWNPIFASIILNQDWTFYISPLDLVFKPWRFFMLICGLPSVVCAVVTLLVMPESPKFIFSHGDEEKTLKVLQKVFSWNTGKLQSSFEVTTLVRDEEFQESLENKPNGLLTFMWSQTVPLFKHPHLTNTLKICFIQFCIFNSSNGFWTFFPEITNRIALWEASNRVHSGATVCEILDDTKVLSNYNQTIDSSICLSKLEASAFQNAFFLNFLYFFGWLFLAFIINRVGKLIILTSLLYSCGITAFALMFVKVSTISNYLYIILLTVGLALTVLNASTVELFPTKVR